MWNQTVRGKRGKVNDVFVLPEYTVSLYRQSNQLIWIRMDEMRLRY